MKPHNRRRTWRRASATVEMAVVTPLLVTLLLGIIEYGWIFGVRQALIHAAAAGARTAALPGSSEDQVHDIVAQQMQPWGITSHTVTLRRATTEDPTESVEVSVPYSDVTLVGAYFGEQNYDLRAACTMKKEGFD